MDVDLFLLGVPAGVGIEHTHAAVLELEVVYLQVGGSVELLEEGGGGGAPCGLAAELYRVEVHEVENVVDFYLVEVCGEGVGLVTRGDAVDDDMLVAAMHGEMVYEQAVLGIDDVGGLKVPVGVVEDDM